MISIKFYCEPQDYAFHLLALMRGVGDAAMIGRLETAEAPATNRQAETYAAGGMTREQIEAALAEARADMDAINSRAAEHTPAPATSEVAAVEARNAAATEARTRKPRAAKEAPAPAPAISSGEERVDPQDTADEAAEAAAAREANGGKLTLNDVRRLAKAYADKYGHEAGVHDLRGIIGCAIPEIPHDDQAALAAAIGKIEHAIATGRPNRPEPPKPAGDTPVILAAIDKVMADAPKPETGSLFGEPEPPKETAAPTATKGEFTQVCIDYAKKFDPKMATDPLKSTMMQNDVNNIGKQATGTSDSKVVMNDPTQIYKVVAAVRQAIEENPFKR